jgi:hypothetical protein
VLGELVAGGGDDTGGRVGRRAVAARRGDEPAAPAVDVRDVEARARLQTAKSLVALTASDAVRRGVNLHVDSLIGL